MSLDTRDARTLTATIGLAIFLLVAAVGIAVVAATIRPWGDNTSATYAADFTSASRLAPNDQVRVAGVVVGKVTNVALVNGSQARVTFTVPKDMTLTDGTEANIRYLNLVGDRYLALGHGTGRRLAPGATISLDRTEPALDLNDLFNGFKPLFAALSPDDVNAFAGAIISTLQGKGTTVTELLEHTATLTSTLADRDAVIGRVVTNLNQVLGSVDDRQDKLEQLIVELTRFMAGLADDRDAIGDSIDHLNELTTVTASLLDEARPNLKTDITELGNLSAQLGQPQALKELETALEDSPDKLARIVRSGAYGSWFNFYLCDLRVDLNPAPGASPLLDLLFSQVESVSAHDSSPRCSP